MRVDRSYYASPQHTIADAIDGTDQELKDLTVRVDKLEYSKDSHDTLARMYQKLSLDNERLTEENRKLRLQNSVVENDLSRAKLSLKVLKDTENEEGWLVTNVMYSQLSDRFEMTKTFQKTRTGDFAFPWGNTWHV